MLLESTRMRKFGRSSGFDVSSSGLPKLIKLTRHYQNYSEETKKKCFDAGMRAGNPRLATDYHGHEKLPVHASKFVWPPRVKRTLVLRGFG